MKPARRPFNPTLSTSGIVVALTAAICLGAVLPTRAVSDLPPGVIEFDTEITSMDLTGTALMPLGPGWGPIMTKIGIRESPTLPSLGKVFAYPGEFATTAQGTPEPNSYFVQSFFDVFFDITLTDIDPNVNFGGSPTEIPAVQFPDNGPARMENFYQVVPDPNLPNWGLIPPPETAPYIGHFLIEIPLGADLNQNGENDKIKFTLVTHTVEGENRTFIQLPDGTVLDTFDSTADLSGAVVDASQDPPFSILLTGPTTVHSQRVPDSFGVGGGLLVNAGVVGFLFALQRRIRKG